MLGYLSQHEYKKLTRMASGKVWATYNLLGNSAEEFIENGKKIPNNSYIILDTFFQWIYDNEIMVDGLYPSKKRIINSKIPAFGMYWI